MCFFCGQQFCCAKFVVPGSVHQSCSRVTIVPTCTTGSSTAVTMVMTTAITVPQPDRKHSFESHHRPDTNHPDRNCPRMGGSVA